MIQPNIRTLANALGRGTIRAEQLVEERLAKARAENATGVFTLLDDYARQQARQVDKSRAAGNAGALAGVPITVKDIFNVRGQQTLAGSKVLRSSAIVESQDGEVIGYLRAAGLVLLGRTNMSEFAFSGMGLNPHYPILYSIWDRQTGRLPGGSSAGSAVSVALGIVPATVGSDTAGSCRIPAAFNGIVGVKPSYGRLSLQGILPLSPSSDAPGPLAIDVDSCFLLDHLMAGNAGNTMPVLETATAGKMRLLIPDGVVLAELAPEVSAAFGKAVSALQRGGVTVIRQPMPVLDACVEMFNSRPIAVNEAWQYHQQMLTTHGDEYDPYVAVRIRNGETVTAAEQQSRYAEKAELTRRFNADYAKAAVDALLYPTVACVPPPVAATLDPAKIGAVNLRCLRNTATVNYFDGCAVSLPCHQTGAAPVGLMLSCGHGEDQKLYRLAATVEAILNKA